MRYDQIDKKASTKHKTLVDEFIKRLDAVLPWDHRAVDATVEIIHFNKKKYYGNYHITLIYNYHITVFFMCRGRL